MKAFKNGAGAKPLIGVLVLALAATGCADMSATQRGTATGAGIGAGLGALIGGTTGGGSSGRTAGGARFALPVADAQRGAYHGGRTPGLLWKSNEEREINNR